MGFLRIVLFLNGRVLVALNKKHLLSLFIGLELIMLRVLFLVRIRCFFRIWVIFLIVCLAVCEARISLALLVIIIRLVGRDLVKNFSVYNLS